jgi:hypothetical protein
LRNSKVGRGEKEQVNKTRKETFFFSFFGGGFGSPYLLPSVVHWLRWDRYRPGTCSSFLLQFLFLQLEVGFAPKQNACDVFISLYITNPIELGIFFFLNSELDNFRVGICWRQRPVKIDTFFSFRLKTKQLDKLFFFFFFLEKMAGA